MPGGFIPNTTGHSFNNSPRVLAKTRPKTSSNSMMNMITEIDDDDFV